MNAAAEELVGQLVAPAELLPPGPEEYGVYYERHSGSYWIPDGGGLWTRVNETGASRYLKIEHGISRKRDDNTGASPMERTLLAIQRQLHVGYAGKLAGYSAGLFEQNGDRILVTASPHLISPAPGEFPTIAQFLDGLFEDQCIYAECWLRIAVEALRKAQIRPGQALVLAGPKDCKKKRVPEPDYHALTRRTHG
jgi:hypothetical protein